MEWSSRLVLTVALLVTPIVIGTVAATAQDSAPAAVAVGVRFADHEDYSRLVLDVPAGTEYEARQDGNHVSIFLAGRFDLDVAALADAGLANISAPEARQEQDRSVLVISVPNGAGLRHFKAGTRVVVDVMASAAMPAAEEADQPVAADPENTPVSTPEDGGGVSEAVEDAPELATVPAFSDNAASDVVGDFRVGYEVVGGLPQLVFDWAYPVATSAFMRAGYLWVIFDEPARANLADVIPYLNNRLVSAEQIPSLSATLLRFEVSDEIASASVARQGSQWIVSLNDSVKEPAKPIVLTRQETNSDGFRLFVPFDRPGAKLTLIDPEVGDELEIVPLLEAGLGAAQSRRFAQFEILDSAQGLIVQKFSDQVVVTRFVNGVSIGSVANLALSAPQLSGRLGELNSAPGSIEAKRIIELEKWRLGGAEQFSRRKQELYRALAEAPREDLNDRRWDIARFYLAHGLASESMAILNLMLEDDPTMTESPPYRAVRGLANLRLGRLEEAQADLDYNQLDAEEDIYLWRALVADARGDAGQALDLYERGRDLVDIYDDEDRAEFRIAAMRSAIELNRIDFANWELTWLRRQPLTIRQRAETDYLEGRFLEAMGENAQALAYYDGVEERDNRKAAAYAKFSMANLRHRLGEMDSSEAAEEMEQLRYSWRGDRFEMALLRRLGDLYLDSGEYRHGLETLREVVAAFPEAVGTRENATRLAEAFKDIFIGGAAEELPPVSALALYYDFRELTPLGSDGDQMIRRLTERLVAVDLLDRAAELLDHQVRFRLEGVAQAVVAVRLAKIHLMNQDADGAMAIMRATRQPQLPADVMHDRNLVEARALIELGRYEEADVLLQGMGGNDVKLLRSDIYWGAQDWPKLVATLDDILGRRWENVLPLSEQERLYVIRQAIAQSMAGNPEQLAVMRARYLGMMQEGRFANAFDIITSPNRHTSDEIRETVRRTAAVDSLQSFMAAYRQEFSSAVSDSAGP